MELSEIVSITGMPGLFKVSGKRNDGLIVTSLLDNKTQFVSGRNHMFTTLDNVTMYTTDEPAALKDVLKSIKENEKSNPIPDLKDDAKTKAWMEKVLPTFDKEKVYVSDMKKLAKWYSILDAQKLIEELLADKATEAEGAADETAKEEEKKPKAKKDTEDKPKKEPKTKVAKAPSSKANTKPAPSAKKITAPRKAQ
jgi:hypothetical protein